ncbi:hypothetical protein V8C34DRAFT_276864 [Trichoderma compactum]
MRFAVVLATMVGLAVAVPKSPLYKRQCPSQPQGCRLKTGTCETCHFGDEPYPCNCECLEVGGCPCTEIDNDLDPPQCLGWMASPECSSLCLTKAQTPTKPTGLVSLLCMFLLSRLR